MASSWLRGRQFEPHLSEMDTSAFRTASSECLSQLNTGYHSFRQWSADIPNVQRWE